MRNIVCFRMHSTLRSMYTTYIDVSHTHSISSDEEESFGRREFPTGSRYCSILTDCVSSVDHSCLLPCSDDDDSPEKRSNLYLTAAPAGPLAQISSAISKDGESDKMEIGSSQSMAT